MDISVASVAVSVAVVTLVTWLLKLLNSLWMKPKRLEKYLRNQGLNGNSYTFLYGDLKDSVKMMKEAKSKPIGLSDDILSRIIPYYNHSVKNNGKNSFMWIGTTPRVNVMDPENIRDVFLKFDDFHKPEVNPLAKLVATGLANYNGDKWAKHRKIINPAFHLEKLKLMVPAFYTSCCEVISQWEKLDYVEGTCEVDIWPYIQNLTMDAISRTAFGSNYEDGKDLLQLQKEQDENAILALQSLYIPGWRFIPTKLNRRMIHVDKQIQLQIRNIINNKKKAMKEKEVVTDDLLGILLETNSKEIDENRNRKNAGMSERDVIEECKLFYFSGQETTSCLLVWTIVLLCNHPSWQERAREEIFRVFGDRKPDYNGLNQLKIVTMILNESLRLYPPLPVINRVVAKETKLGNITLPEGALISMPVILVHHDYELWGEDVNEFKPERFAEGVANATKNRVSFFPLGWGPRTCIGQNFAMIEAKIALTMILRSFSFELSPSYIHAPSPVLTIQPQFGCRVTLRKC